MPGFELSEISTKYQQESTEELRPKSNKMYVSTGKAVVFVMLAVILAVGVGIIVHFAGPGTTIECHCNYRTTGDSGSDGGTSAAIEQCKDWASEGNADICTACPSASSTSTHAPITTTSTTSPEVTTEAPPEVIDVRLPKALDPLLYTVELQPHMYDGEPADFYFNGSVTIKLHCKSNTNNITVHSNKLDITGDINIYEENNMIESMYDSHDFDLDRQFLVVMTTQELQANKNYIMEITYFRGPLLGDLAGLYLSSYTRENKTIHIATTQFQPTDARKTFPCMDEPAIKAEFDVTLVRKSNMISISNSPIIQTENRGDGWVADKFQTTAKMSTYLLAFIICDFDYIENKTSNNVTYRAYARPEAIDQANYSLEIGVPILDYFEEYFGIPYPLPKQDMIAIPDFAAGAMENWGLITYRETAMLYEPGVSSEGNKQRVAIVVSHELAHQWFGNLVTPSWWDDLWLNEGFASYVEYMGVDHYHPDWKMFDQFVTSDLQSVFEMDGLISSHPVYVPVAHPDEINEIFDTISYAKGASIIRMMRFFLGDSVFRQGLTNYLKNLAYDAAFHDDLWNALSDEAKAQNHRVTDVKKVMDTWVLQMNYPVVYIKHEDGSVIVTQHRYLKDPNATDPKIYTSPFNYTWHIPFALATSSNPKFNVTSDDVKFLERNTEPVTINHADIPAPGGNNWVLGNPKQYGYYRVNYEVQNWNALITQLRSNHEIIDPINRAQIINDAWSLAASGELDMTIALRTTEYLQNEREYVPWDAASAQLTFVGSMLARDKLYGSFQKFMQNKTMDVFKDLTMNNTGATHLESFMRSEISSLACQYGITECVNEAVALYKQWMESDPEVNPIDPGLKSTVYCTAVGAGGIDEWEFALKQYRTANLAAEKSRLLYAMACSKQSWILSRYLEMAIDPNEIRLQDSTSVISYIAGNTIGRSLAWDFFRQNWDKLLEVHSGGINVLQRLVNEVTAASNTQFDLKQLKAFIDSKDNLGSAARAFEQALEKTQSNIKWMEANVPVIESWLHAQGF